MRTCEAPTYLVDIFRRTVNNNACTYTGAADEETFTNCRQPHTKMAEIQFATLQLKVDSGLCLGSKKILLTLELAIKYNFSHLGCGLYFLPIMWLLTAFF